MCVFLTKYITYPQQLPDVVDDHPLHCVLPKVGLVTESQHLACARPIPNIRSVSAERLPGWLYAAVDGAQCRGALYSVTESVAGWHRAHTWYDAHM